jgi:hypothetical protein
MEERYSSCFTSQQSSWKQDTRLALHHNYPSRSTVLVSSHRLALCHNYQFRSKMLILLYITIINWEAGYYIGFTSQLSSQKLSSHYITSSCFTSQPSGWKQDTRLDLHHTCQARISVLVTSHLLALHHNHPVGNKILDWLYVTVVKLEAQY